MAESVDVPLDAQIACVEREVRMRKSAYPRWVANGKMSQGKANTETQLMEAVLATLRKLKGQETLL